MLINHDILAEFEYWPFFLLGVDEYLPLAGF